ncbi:TPA: hypothetical protein L3684_002812 [Pseudomonas aeruginosa]|nr:hypothetical protein [Pseudomonas aeruginosa]
MSSTQHQLIEQCATRLRGIVEALDNIHDNTPHRWSTDLDDVHSSAESLLAMIKDQAPPPCIDCKGTGFCNSISGEEIRYPCHAPIQLADPAQTPVEQFEQAPPSEDQLTAAGLSYPLAKEDAVNLWYAGFRSEVVTVLEAWEAIGHDIGMNPSKGELLDSLRYMLEKCEAHDDALARVKALEALVAARIKDVPVDAPVIAVVGDFNEEQVHECKRFHDAIRAQRNPKAIVVFLNSKNDIQAVDEAAMCAAGWVRAEAPVAQAEQAEAERSALWAVHAQGPDELYAAFSREDAEKHAAELNALPMPEGIAVGAVVVPSPWPAVQHWQYLAEQEQDHKNEIAGRLRQHERIGEALRAEITQLRQHKNDYMDAGQETYRALQNEIREREAEIARLDGLVSGHTAERDAALARVAELERKLRNEENAHTTTIEQRDNAEHWADQLANAIAERFGVDIGEHSNLNCPWNEALVWMQQPPAQAQHSVPEVSGIGRDFAYPRSVVLYLRTEPTDDDLRAIQDGLRSLAAAPQPAGGE